MINTPFAVINADDFYGSTTLVWLSLELFENFAKGLIESAGQSLTEMEIKYLRLCIGTYYFY